MELQQAMEMRHSVRRYTDRKIEGEVLERLQQAIAEANRDSGLNIQLCLNEPDAFSGAMARYGKFHNAVNYLAFTGKKDRDLDEKCGYYGEKIVLRAQQLGLNTCWVAASYSKGKSAAVIKPGEKLLLVISIGYGENNGVARKTKTTAQLCRTDGTMPEWFLRGVQAAQLAPTAMNQQKFRFELDGQTVKAVASLGPYTKVDLGIAKYHFELGAGEAAEWQWAD
jgi:nitroreductase